MKNPPPTVKALPSKLQTKADAAQAKANALLDELRTKAKNKLSSGLDPKLAAIAIRYALAETEAGALRFAAFAKRIFANVPPERYAALKPYFESGWRVLHQQGRVEDAAGNLDDYANIRNQGETTSGKANTGSGHVEGILADPRDARMEGGVGSSEGAVTDADGGQDRGPDVESGARKPGSGLPESDGSDPQTDGRSKPDRNAKEKRSGKNSVRGSDPAGAQQPEPAKPNKPDRMGEELQDAADQDNQGVDRKWKELGDAMAGLLSMDPKLQKLAAELVVLGVNAEALNFAAFVARGVEQLREKNIRSLGPKPPKLKAPPAKLQAKADAAQAEADAPVDERITNAKSKLSSGLDPVLARIAVRYTIAEIEAGTLRFADFAERIISGLSAEELKLLRPYLEGAWKIALRKGHTDDVGGKIADYEQTTNQGETTDGNQEPAPAKPNKPDRLGEKIQDAADKANQDFDDTWKELGDAMDGLLSMNPMLNPELQQIAARLVVAGVRAKTLDFAAFVLHGVERLGEQKIRTLGPLLEASWDAVRSAYNFEGMTPSQSVVELLDERIRNQQPGPPTATKKLGVGRMKTSKPIHATESWRMALDHLVEHWPTETLAKIENQTLKEELDDRVIAYLKQMEAIRKQTSDQNQIEMAREIVQARTLFADQNPQWGELPPMTKEQKAQVKLFVKQTRARKL